jgi:ATP-dependent HslUV protease subunit HslV
VLFRSAAPLDIPAKMPSLLASSLAAAKALLRHSDLSAAEIARTSMEIAANICIYTNDQITVISLGEDSD